MTPEEEKLNNMIVKLTAYAPTQPDMLVCARILDLCDAAQALQSENARLRLVLQEHHKWQCENNIHDPEHGFSFSAEYADSGMCERTLAALKGVV